MKKFDMYADSDVVSDPKEGDKSQWAEEQSIT